MLWPPGDNGAFIYLFYLFIYLFFKLSLAQTIFSFFFFSFVPFSFLPWACQAKRTDHIRPNALPAGMTLLLPHPP